MTLRLPFVLAASLCLATPALSDPDAGSYLAGRHAGLMSDYDAAARYLGAALVRDPSNLALMEQTLTANLGTGQIESAAAIARPFINIGGQSQIANIALMAQAARVGNWDAIFDQLEAGHNVSPLIDSLAQAWAHLGKGNVNRALQSFDELIDTPSLRPIGLQHKAFAFLMLDELEAADKILSLPASEGVPPTRTTVIAHLHVLTRMGAFDRAKDVLDRSFGIDPSPEPALLQAAIAAGEVPDLALPVATPADGIALTYLTLADILQDDANEAYLLLYAQAARHIAPHIAQAHIATARLLNNLDQYDAAAQTFAQVLTEDPAFFDAEVGRADALRLAGRTDQAIEVLTQLTRSHPGLPLSYASLGDIHRQSGQFELAIDAYSAALEIYPDDAPIRWLLTYSRGISHERLNNWEQAEADFREALALNPDHPSVLNYLGYSMVDRGQTDNYGEALVMIEKAVAARPDSGAITDSLAWVYYKLGRYQDAVAPMERAVELEPNDPIISDHLGDVYWMVGRKTEARFQWRRALSFGPEDAEAERIRRKLAIGLDAVYAEDGEVPAPAVEVEVANDD